MQYYGFGLFSGALPLAGLFAPPFLSISALMYGAATVGVIGGVASLIASLWPDPRHVPTLVFVSTGGTCRDPMAKLIVEELLQGREPPIRIYAAALKDPPYERSSKAARQVVSEAMGADLLKDHKPIVLDERLAAEADLILAMTDDHAHALKKSFYRDSGKIYSIHRFLGKIGEIEDPWRDGPEAIDAATLDRYRRCFASLKAILTENIEIIRSAVLA